MQYGARLSIHGKATIDILTSSPEMTIDALRALLGGTDDGAFSEALARK